MSSNEKPHGLSKPCQVQLYPMHMLSSLCMPPLCCVCTMYWGGLPEQEAEYASC